MWDTPPGGHHAPDCSVLRHIFGFPGPKVTLKVKLRESFQAKASQDSSFLDTLQKVVLRKGDSGAVCFSESPRVSARAGWVKWGGGTIYTSSSTHFCSPDLPPPPPPIRDQHDPPSQRATTPSNLQNLRQLKPVWGSSIQLWGVGTGSEHLNKHVESNACLGVSSGSVSTRQTGKVSCMPGSLNLLLTEQRCQLTLPVHHRSLEYEE